MRKNDVSAALLLK